MSTKKIARLIRDGIKRIERGEFEYGCNAIERRITGFTTEGVPGGQQASAYYKSIYAPKSIYCSWLDRLSDDYVSQEVRLMAMEFAAYLAECGEDFGD